MGKSLAVPYLSLLVVNPGELWLLFYVFMVYFVFTFYCIYFSCLQCFDAVGWAAGRASGL